MRRPSAAALLASLGPVAGWLVSAAAAAGGTTVAITVGPAPDERAADSAVPQCSDAGASVFWPVFLTLLVVLVAALVGYFFWKYYWRIRHGKHLVLVTDVEKADPEYAFDNPGFREGTPVIRSKKQPVDTKENTNRDDSNMIKSVDENRHHTSDNLRFSNGASPTVVPLKGRDFAGLGFGICGTKRDGIFVKDLLHHGPASESGRIKTGDRITAVRINFGEMEFKDAEDILRSASPYEIEIEIEDKNSGVKRSFFRDQSYPTTRSQVNNLAYANGTATKNDLTSSKPAVLEVVSEVSDKMSKYGVKVLPDINCRTNSNAIIINQPVTSKKQTAAATSPALPVTIASSTVVVVDPHAASFDEVDLPLPRSNLVDEAPNSRTAADKANPASNLVSSLKDANVKKAFVMGYQNLKEKITQRVHKSNSTASPKEESHAVHMQSADDCDQVDGSKVEHIDLRLRSSSVSSTEADDSAPKAAKRKAPRPPEATLETSSSSDERCPAGVASGDFNLLNEIDDEVKKHTVDGDSDSDTEETDRVLHTTIELNASHITVHHGADDTNRKAASMGDLSKIEGDEPRAQPLERAVSLELAEHTPCAGKKRKAPRPPEESATGDGADEDSDCAESVVPKLKKSSMFGTLEAPAVFAPPAEVDVAPVAAPKLKKSSLFGTMEEALKTTTDSSDSDEPAGSGHCSMVSSTPLKVTRVQMDGWHLPAQNGEVDDDDSENETAPALPTSPVPTLPAASTFVTEIDVEVAPSSAIAAAVLAPAFADSEDAQDATLFTTAAELNFSRVPDDEPLATVNGDCATNVGSADDDSRDDCSSMDTVKEMSRDETTSISTAANTSPLVANSPPATRATPSPATPVSIPSTEVSATAPSPTTLVLTPPTEVSNMVTVQSSSTVTTPVISEASASVASTVAKFQNSSPSFTKPENSTGIAKPESPVSSTIAKFEVTTPTSTGAEETLNGKTNSSRSNSSSSSTSSMSSSSTRSANSSSNVNGSARTSPRRFSSGGGIGVEARIKSPGGTVKSPKLSQSVSPVRAVGSRIPVRANTEPSLKVSLIHKEDSPNKSKKYDGALENGKVNFVSSNHIANSPHKTSVLSDTRHNGPNR